MKYLVLVAIALLTGCATISSPLTAENAQNLTGESLVITKHESPDFIAMTASKGMFAALGAVAAISEGNKFVETNEIEDPASYIADDIAQRLSERYTMEYAGQMEQTLDGEDASAVASKLPEHAYAVDVATKTWMFIYDGFNFSDYTLMYAAYLNLIDTRTGTPIAQGDCSYNTKEEIGTVSYEKLVADDAAFIKEQLNEAANRCVNQFSAELLKL